MYNLLLNIKKNIENNMKIYIFHMDKRYTKKTWKEIMEKD